MRRIWTMLAVVALCALVLSATILAAGSATQSFDKAETYVWFAEFVSFDEAAGTLTAKAHVRYDVKPEYEEYKAGDRIMLQWYTSAWGETDGLQHLARKEEIDRQGGRYVLPVEFVAIDSAAKTVTFKTAVKGDASATLKSLSPGATIKGTSPYWPAPEDDMILAIDRHESQPRASD